VSVISQSTTPLSTVNHYCLPIGQFVKNKPCQFSSVTSLCTLLNCCLMTDCA